ATKRVVDLTCIADGRKEAPRPTEKLKDTKKRLQGTSELPVEELKGIVELHRIDNEALRRDYSYDVRKTDSLVSPYVGIVSYSFNLPNERDYEVTFAYQDQRWVAKN